MIFHNAWVFLFRKKTKERLKRNKRKKRKKRMLTTKGCRSVPEVFFSRTDSLELSFECLAFELEKWLKIELEFPFMDFKLLLDWRFALESSSFDGKCKTNYIKISKFKPNMNCCNSRLWFENYHLFWKIQFPFFWRNKNKNLYLKKRNLWERKWLIIGKWR